MGRRSTRGLLRDAGVLGVGKRKQGSANPQLPVYASLNDCSEVCAGVDNLTIVCPLHSDGKRGDRRVRSQIVFRLGPYPRVDCSRDAKPAARRT